MKIRARNFFNDEADKAESDRKQMLADILGNLSANEVGRLRWTKITREEAKQILLAARKIARIITAARRKS